MAAATKGMAAAAEGAEGAATIMAGEVRRRWPGVFFHTDTVKYWNPILFKLMNLRDIMGAGAGGYAGRGGDASK